MVLAMRHGVLGYEAMDLNHLFPDPVFGVFNYAATRNFTTATERLDWPPAFRYDSTE